MVLSRDEVMELYTSDERCHVCGCKIAVGEEFCWQNAMETYSVHDGRGHRRAKFIFHEACLEDIWEHS